MRLDTQAQQRQFFRYYKNIGPILEKPRTRTYTAVIFSFLAIALFAFYAIRPTIQTIIYLQKEIADKTVINQQMEEKITKLIEAQAAYQEASPLVPAVADALPSQSNVFNILNQLRNLASEKQASITAIRTAGVPLTSAPPLSSKATQASGTHEENFIIQLTVVGNYQQVQSFLQDLLAMRRIITVDTLKIDSSGEGTPVVAGKILKLTLQLKAYYLP